MFEGRMFEDDDRCRFLFTCATYCLQDCDARQANILHNLSSMDFEKLLRMDLFHIVRYCFLNIALDLCLCGSYDCT